MWHASASFRGQWAPDSQRRAQTELMLLGVGDPALGEWTDSRPTAFHLRRRLSLIEAEGLEMRDVRRTPEAAQRYLALPLAIQERVPDAVFIEEVGDL